ncbi:MAG TPA: Na+/H+ antiporter subunit E [Stenotrophomonas sp.]|jgi:multicomponent Na+:H+ antiporter subunit E
MTGAATPGNDRKPSAGDLSSAAGEAAARDVPRTLRRRRRPAFGTAAMRALGFFIVWIVLMPSAKPADLTCGAVATLLATWTSLRLMPPSQGHLRFAALLMLVPHFLWQSVLAGLDVARRALHPRMPMNPGLVECPLAFPPGMTLNTFATITSLLPGSVPCGQKPGVLVYHCLDRGLPNLEQLKKEEQLFARALIPGPAQGDG